MCVLQERQRYKAVATEYVSILSFFSGILVGKCLLNARLEHIRSNLVFDIRYDFILVNALFIHFSLADVIDKDLIGYSSVPFL